MDFAGGGGDGRPMRHAYPVARRHQHARIVTHALDLAGGLAGGDVEPPITLGEPDRRWQGLATPAVSSEEDVLLAVERGEGVSVGHGSMFSSARGRFISGISAAFREAAVR